MIAPNDNVQLVIQELEKVGLHFLRGSTYEELVQALSAHINHLITTDFSKLISILYRLDISETKLRQLLDAANDISAGLIIASLIIERQMQKLEARKNFKNGVDIPEDEKW